MFSDCFCHRMSKGTNEGPLMGFVGSDKDHYLN